MDFPSEIMILRLENPLVVILRGAGSPDLENHKNASKKISDRLQRLAIDSTRGYSMPTKYEGHPTTLSGLLRLKIMIFDDFSSKSRKSDTFWSPKITFFPEIVEI